jgi:hypothetical protein
MEQKARVDPEMIGVAFNAHPADLGAETDAISVTLEHWPTGKQVTLVSNIRNFGAVWNTETTARLWEQAFKLLEIEVTKASA